MIKDYMANFATYRHNSYDGGLNNTDSRRDIERDQASVLENWDISMKGRLQSRAGLTQVGDTQLGTIYGAGHYQKSVGTHYLLINEGKNVKYLGTNSFVAVGTASTVSTAERMDFANCFVEDKIYMSSENNGLLAWDGGAGGLVTIASSVSGNRILWYQNHLFHVNNVNVSSTKYPNRIYWSDFGDPEAYTTGSSFVELPGEGRAITMNVLGNSLVIFKENSYMFMSGYGSNSWALTASSTSIANTDSSVGCVAVRGTVRVSANELWFIDNQGYIRKLSQTDYGFNSKVMSNNLEDSRRDFNMGQLSNAVAWYDDEKIYFAVPTGSSTTNNLVLVFDRLASERNGGKEAWTTYTGWEVNDFISYGTSTPVLYVVGGSSKKVYIHSGGSDDGVDISCRWDGKNDDYNKPERWKKHTYGYVYSQAQADVDIDIYASVDGTTFAHLSSFNIASQGTALGPTGSAIMGPTGSFILGGNTDLEKKYYFADGGGAITGKTVVMSIRCITDTQVYVDNFTNHFIIRSLK